MWGWLDPGWRQARRDRRARADVDWRDASYVAVDLETNGLHCDADGILSIAWVVLSANGLSLSTARCENIHTDQELNQSAIHHGLQEQDIRNGLPLTQVLNELSGVLENRFLVAHNAPFDWRLLQLGERATGVPLRPAGIIDTLMLERQRLGHPFRHQPMVRAADGAFTLPVCAERFNLPSRPAHHALEDAMACGELFLAQAWHLSRTRAITAHELVHRSRQRLLAT